MLRATLPATIEIKHDIDPECGVVMANATQIHQVILNLATNASYAMQEKGGELSILLKMEYISDNGLLQQDIPAGDYACLIVMDSGEGMSSDVLSRLFDPYFTTKENGKGTGLGLSVVKGIIESHQGSITVSSELGIGSIFTIYLPITGQMAQTVAVELQIPDPKGVEKILIVDDEEPIIQMEKDMLEQLGYEIVATISSEEALKTFEGNLDSFEMLITDMTMPKLTGEALTKLILKLKPGLPVVMCTGFSELIDERKAKEIGIKAFLRKPITQSTLARTIRNVFDEQKG